MTDRRTVEIDMDKPCKRCGKGGATGNGYCLRCGLKLLPQVLEKIRKGRRDERNHG